MHLQIRIWSVHIRNTDERKRKALESRISYMFSFRAGLLSGSWRTGLVKQPTPLLAQSRHGNSDRTLLKAPENVLNSVRKITSENESTSWKKPSCLLKQHTQTHIHLELIYRSSFWLVLVFLTNSSSLADHRSRQPGGMTYFCPASGRCSSPYYKFTMQNTCYKINSLPPFCGWWGLI